jgi:hypothetical protein
MQRATAISIGVLAFLTASVAAAQDIKTEPDQRYLVIEVNKLSTFEKELNSAANQGFRLMMSTTSEEGQKIQALMERVVAPPQTYEYRMVATFSEKTGDKEMNAAAAEGFRVLSHTAMVKQGLTIFNRNSVVIMEKAPESSPPYTYMTISAVKTSTFHKELKAAVEQGWKVVDMTYGQVLLERSKG